MTQAMNFAEMGKQAAQTDDLTQNKSFEREVPKEGLAFLRLIGYVELGRHQPKNPAHKPALRARLTFELSHKKHLIEIDGKMVPSKITIETNKGATAKSGFKKIFNMMNKALGGGHTTFFGMMGKPMLGDVYHNVVEKAGEDKVTYANLDNDGAYSFRSPTKEDELTGEMITIPVPELHNEMQGFLWENESMTDEQYVAMWDSLFIDGEREDKDGKKVSKNFIQEKIMKNMEWEGSTCQALTQEHVDLGDMDMGGDDIDLGSAAETDDPISM